MILPRSFMTRFWQTTLSLFLIAFSYTLFAAELPRPLLLVLNKPEGKLLLVDPATKKVVGEVATGNGPHEVTVSADGKLAFVANYGDQTPGESISVIDLEIWAHCGVLMGLWRARARSISRWR